MRIILLSVTLLVLSACSNENDKQIQQNSTHVFKAQQDVLDQAKQVEQILQTGQDNRSKEIDNQIKQKP